MIDYEKLGNVAVITINRPDARNAVNTDVANGIEAAIDQLEADDEVWVGILTGAKTEKGYIFCAGADLKQMAVDPGGMQTARGGFAGFVTRERTKPVIAAVNGAAVAGGFEIVLACDLVVMSTEARLVEPFVDRGILPDSGAIHLLTRIVGLRKAAELLMLGEPVDAAECERLGLVNRVVATDDVDRVAEDLAGRLAAGPTVMLALTKRLLAVSSESGRDRAFEQEAWAQEVVSRTADLQEGLSSFAERRKPHFRGF